MFCPKCGTQNPETGKFCRSCGTDLGNVSQALSGQLPPPPAPLLDHKGKPVSIERAVVKVFTGLAFIAVAVALMVTGNGRGWWFWMLIPAFTSIGAGVAQYLHILSARKDPHAYNPTPSNQQLYGQQPSVLPPNQTAYIEPESRFKTGDLVPPSVTDATTRHLDLDSEGKTMTLPKK